MIKKILSKYYKIKETPTFWSILCPFCEKENRVKEIYFYSNDRCICYRCKLVGRDFKNSFVLLAELLKLKGVGDYKLETMSKLLNYVDIGEKLVIPLFSYPDDKFTPGYLVNEVKEYLLSRNFNLDIVLPYLWYGNKGRLRGMICAPLYPSGWIGRSMKEKEYRIFKKSSFLPIFSVAPNLGRETVFLVEGVWDALRLWEYGYDSISLLGLNVSPYARQLLRKKNPGTVYVWLDNDNPARKNEDRIIKELLLEDYFVHVIHAKEPGDCKTKEEIDQAIKSSEEISLEEVFK